MKKMWWQEPMRVLQYNLQVKDTQGMVPEKIAKETVELGSNVVVMNVGGIYAWYRSRVPFHHINEYLPDDSRDLLRELIEAFHKENIRFVARFDFSIAEDKTYLNHPEWFSRTPDMQPIYRGEKRMGEWSLLLNTCALGGYRNEDVAVPVLKEVLENYDIDGIFLNAPHATACFCDRCRDQYWKRYHKELPDDALLFEPDWLSACMKENIGHMYKAIKSVKNEIPLILYYTPLTGLSKSFGRFDRDNIYDRYATADLICTESQDVLSRGVHHIPVDIHPVIAMKSGQLPGRKKLPFGIIHSCPGMDWRHVGMPVTEYLPWMAQVPASGGVLWHSVTGYADTIADKRVLEAVREIDERVIRIESDMEDAQYLSQIGLLWDGSESACAWADILTRDHFQYDMIQDYSVSGEVLSQYSVVVVPDHYPLSSEVIGLLEKYTESGGKVLLESTDSREYTKYCRLLGVDKKASRGENLTASYLFFEKEGAVLKKGMDTDKIEMRGYVAYVHPAAEAKVLATLIPPFAPYEVVGAPPERSSIPVKHTDIPLVLTHNVGKGSVTSLTFSLGLLAVEYQLGDHYDLAENLLDFLLGEEKELEVFAPHGVQVTAYRKDRDILIHLVNEVGKRPLMDQITISEVRLKLHRTGNQKVMSVQSVIEDNPVTYEDGEQDVEIKLSNLKIWDMIRIHFN